MLIKITMNDNKCYIIENLIYENDIINIIDFLNIIMKLNYKYSDIICLELHNCSNIKSIPKCLNNLKTLKIFNCKHLKNNRNIPKIKSLKYIEFIKPKIIKINHKKLYK